MLERTRCKLGQILAGLLSALLVTACVSDNAPLPASGRGDAQFSESYRLGTGDKFRLNVFNEPTLSGSEYIVDTEGSASLPLIGAVEVSGKTIREAEAAITARYGDGYLESPKVNINIVSFRPFYILGEVNSPGEYTFADDLTVLSAVAKAGGFTYRADRRRVFIRRAGQGSEQEVTISADTPVMPGDTVRVAERVF